jgi:hypothetical protein
MLEEDLTESVHAWYELEEHLLEVKMEVSFLIEEGLICEMANLAALFLN